jgi:hypothetical protein
VLRLTALFALDSFGGGFTVKAMLAVWLFQRFGLSTQTGGMIFFVASLLAGFSQLGSTWLARADRTDPHDGLHASARERVPRARGVHARPPRSR